jgi:XTP/dITP diphosphohydrolase
MLRRNLLIASNNTHKITEIQAVLTPILLPYQISLVPQGELDIPEAEEPYNSFVENALTKARNASRISGLPALADDSGLLVDVLKGEPGVHSAVYAGLPRSDDKNNQKLRSMIQGQTNKNARFVCCLVMVRWESDPLPMIAHGVWHGEITEQPRGAQGFGYDPLFYVPSLNKTVAELSLVEKNQLSHRAKALEDLTQQLARYPDWLSSVFTR